jgi:hypothetical protein
MKSTAPSSEGVLRWLPLAEGAVGVAPATPRKMSRKRHLEVTAFTKRYPNLRAMERNIKIPYDPFSP